MVVSHLQGFLDLEEVREEYEDLHSERLVGGLEVWRHCSVRFRFLCVSVAIVLVFVMMSHPLQHFVARSVLDVVVESGRLLAAPLLQQFAGFGGSPPDDHGGWPA